MFVHYLTVYAWKGFVQIPGVFSLCFKLSSSTLLNKAYEATNIGVRAGEGLLFPSLWLI